MKFPAIILAFMLPLALHAGPITQKPLDEFVIYEIPVAQKTGTTTIMFPSQISGLKGPRAFSVGTKAAPSV